MSIFLLVFLFSSCQEEPELIEENNNVFQNGMIINGRFFFESKKLLSDRIDNFKEKSTDELEGEFEEFYQKGFRSHRPIINSENEELIKIFSEEYINKRKGILKSSSNNEEEEEFIADPLFAALINGNNEIIVSDTIYKYTKDKGLFFAHVKDSVHLFEFVENESRQINSKSSMAESIVPCDEMQLSSPEITQMDDVVSRFIVPIDDCSGGGSGGGGGGNPTPPQITSEEKLQQIISDLPICDGNAGGNWFQNIFGKSYVCRSYFDDKHRIKTEFWDQSWLVYKSVGVLTKTQRKRLGIWWASESDEIHLGINRIFLKYNYETPKIKFLSYTPTSAYKSPIYLYKSDFIVRQGKYGHYMEVQLDVTKNNIPFFDFEQTDILNIYVPSIPLFGDYELDFTNQDIYSQSNIKKLYKLGIDFLKENFSSGAKKEFVISYQRSPTEIEVLYFGERIHKTNENKIKRKFYDDVGFVIGAAKTLDGSGGWKFSVETIDDYFRNYTHYEVDFYGMARRGTTWKGNRMIR